MLIRSQMLLIALLCPLADATASEQRADDIAMVMYFSFREATQLHWLAQGLAMASINGASGDDVSRHCERAINGLKSLSVPMLRKYLSSVKHDQHCSSVFRKITEAQEHTLAELMMVKAMADSGNGQAERQGFVQASERVSRTLEEAWNLLSGADNGTGRGSTRREGAGNRTQAISRAFADEEWVAIAAELQRRGLLGGQKEASDYSGVFSLLKSVFVDEQITEPTPSQLFGLADLLSLPFGSMEPTAIEKQLSVVLRLSKDIGMAVLSREELLRLGD